MITDSTARSPLARPARFGAWGVHLLAAAGLAALGLLALGMTAAAADAEPVVVITETLEPVSLEVAPGTSVTWRNDDADRHRVRSTDGPEDFDSGNLESGESFTFTFSLEGSYAYADHRNDDDPAYFGTIVVTAGGQGGSQALSDTGSVSIIDRAFRPPTLEVATGGSVTWTNDDGEGHTVTSTTTAFDSGIMAGGAEFSQTFAEAGSYPYFCVIHTEMQGTVVVSDPVEGTGAPALPTEAAVAASPATSPSASPTDSASPSASPTDSASPSASPTDSASPSASPTDSASPSASPTDSASPSASPTDSASPSASPTDSASPSASGDPVASPSIAPASPGSVASATTVSAIGREFQPGTVEVAVGETVSWSNDDTEAHTVTALDGSFNSGMMAAGAEFSSTFDTPGTFDYLCAIHPEMKGTVTVMGASASLIAQPSPSPITE